MPRSPRHHDTHIRETATLRDTPLHPLCLNIGSDSRGLDPEIPHGHVKVLGRAVDALVVVVSVDDRFVAEVWVGDECRWVEGVANEGSVDEHGDWRADEVAAGGHVDVGGTRRDCVAGARAGGDGRVEGGRGVGVA